VGQNIIVTGTGLNSTVRTASNNQAIGAYTTVFGSFNYAVAGSAAIGGGYNNCVFAGGTCGFIGGGFSNRNCGATSVVGGGQTNTTVGIASTIGGGILNITQSNCSTIAGGASNVTSQTWSSIGGGCANRTFGQYSNISGGRSNTTTTFGTNGTINGGWLNTVNSLSSFIGGGCGNTTCGDFSTIVGGQLNTTTCNHTHVLGCNILTNQAFTTYVNNLTVNGGGLAQTRVTINSIPTEAVLASLPIGSVYRCSTNGDGTGLHIKFA
jgi:hypothetical protein